VNIVGLGWIRSSGKPAAVTRRRHRPVLSVLACCAGIVGLLGSAVIEAGTAQADSGSWSITDSANQGAYPELNGVFCLSETDCVAVGYGDNSSGTEQTLIESWDGTSWSIEPSPNEDTGDNQLNGVSCLNPTACFAVGYTGNTGGPQQTLIEAWNGTAWSIASSPNEGTGSNQLNAVSCPSSSDCIAVGYAPGGSLIESWNGDGWSITSSDPNEGLGSITCLNVNFCVAVGATGTSTFIEAWNGTSWSVMPSPNQGTSGSYLTGVSCSSSTSCVAVGQYQMTDDGLTASQNLAESWNGTNWSITQTAPFDDGSVLLGVSCVNSSNCTAVGFSADDSGPEAENYTLAESWNGVSWSVVETPNPGNQEPWLQAVSCASIGNCIAVGFDKWNTLALMESEPTAPTVSSADEATFTAGQVGAYSITTSGYPASAVTDGGASLPGGVSFVDNGNGTATLSGDPQAGTAGVYTFTVSASNGVQPDATQSFTLTVDPPPPAITSSDSTIFVVGQSGSFVVTTTGFPSAPALSETGKLPSGVTITDNGNGTATLGGTAAADSSGTYPITITATSSQSPGAVQDFTLTVVPLKIVASALRMGTLKKHYSASLTAVGGNPPYKWSVVPRSGSLPPGLKLNSKGVITGKPKQTGTYSFTVKVSDSKTKSKPHSQNTTTQSFSITIS
jgi:hypothetical protein